MAHPLEGTLRGTLHRAAAALRSVRGVSAIEFALIAPLMILTLLGAFDLGNAIQQRIRLEAAARAGAQYAVTNPSDATGTAAVVRANLAGWSDITIEPPVRTCRCDDGAAVDCATGICNSGNGAPITYISVTVTRPFTFISPVSALLLPSLATLKGNVEIRI
ncbi:MAG: pilus assembly protein [Acetobacteraceae bacterium]|nr:pilus assembly protein [Acetobacteraceae bacterium]